jgi:hypothetical protein
MGCLLELRFALDFYPDLTTIQYTMRHSPIFRALAPGSEHLALARLSNCAQRLLAYADEQGGLALTPGGGSRPPEWWKLGRLAV